FFKAWRNWYNIASAYEKEGRGDLVARSRPRDRRAAGPKPDSTEDPSCMVPAARQIIRSGQTPSRWCGAEAWREGASSGVVLVIRPWLKITRSVLNSPRVASERDVNIT
ncbi:hypothetical protein AVEN_46662-1, partial [Araneus ventricosus]